MPDIIAEKKCRCLRFCPIGVQGDARVGAFPGSVEFLMAEIAAELQSGLLALDVNVVLRPKDKLRYAVTIACNVFVHFLTIHPYVKWERSYRAVDCLVHPRQVRSLASAMDGRTSPT